MNRVQVIAVTGAPGVGKTSVGARLGRSLPGPTVTIDTDALACVWPWEETEQLLDLMAANLLDTLLRAVAWGARTIVVSGVLLPGRMLPRLRPLLERPDLEWAWYGLRARPETLARRIAAFEGVHDPALRASMSHLDALVATVPGITSISTDELTLDQIVSQIADHEAARPRASAAETAQVVAVGPRELTALAVRALVGRGVAHEDAAAIVARLIAADRAGASSHGLMRVEEYCRALDDGDINPVARPHLARTGAAWLLEGRRAGGWHTAERISSLLADAAAPVVVVRVARAGHLGRLRDLVLPAVRAGRVAVGFATYSGSGQKVAPPGSADAVLATNPLVVGFPSAGMPVVVDVSTSAWSEGAVRFAGLVGRPIPAGVLVHPDGGWSHDAAALYENDLTKRASLAGLGRQEGSAKGFALGVAVELLGGGLGGGVVCESASPVGREGNSALFVSLDPTLLGHDARELESLIERFSRFVTSRRALDPDHPVRVPGAGPEPPTEWTPDALPGAIVARLRELAGVS